MRAIRNSVAGAVALAAGVASAGVARMESKPVWDLADHGGARTLSSAIVKAFGLGK